jgi:hypothetical protein
VRRDEAKGGGVPGLGQGVRLSKVYKETKTRFVRGSCSVLLQVPS